MPTQKRRIRRIHTKRRIVKNGPATKPFDINQIIEKTRIDKNSYKNSHLFSCNSVTMTSLHMYRTDKLADDFNTILQLTEEITRKKEGISKKLRELRDIYNGLVKNNTKKIFLFCLDSFFFQYKTLQFEMDNIGRYISLLHNRIYADYYKLYNIMVLQTSEAHPDIRILAADAKYPAYKDLEPFFEYSVDDIKRIHADIIKIIDSLYATYAGKERSIHGYNDNSRVGLSIVNFIHTLEYENTLLHEQIGLYFNYLSYFHTSQIKYLTKLFLRIHSFQTEIEEDIMINHQNARPIQDIHLFEPPVDLTEFIVLPEESPIVEPVSEPVSQTVAEPVLEPVSQNVPEPVVEPVSQTVPEPQIENITATIVESTNTLEEVLPTENDVTESPDTSITDVNEL